MPERLRTRLGIATFIVVVAAIWLATPMPAHPHAVDCTGRAGIDLARCERHRQMAARCGAIQGEAHFACDRDFLLAHPLDCKAFAGDDARRCEAEVAASNACEPRQGREFVRCVRDAIQASPMGGR